MFDYNRAFSRNLGWVTETEQQQLKHFKVAIAGLGGVGGEHLLTLCRLGVQRFSLADFDQFDVHNFNRQAGANIHTIDEDKLAVMARMAAEINPDAELTCFEQGVTAENVDAFLAGADIYVDSLDFFALDARKLVFKRCEELGIPVVTAAPLGMGCAFLSFMPGKMSFEQYFCFENHSREEQLLRFLVGVSPAMLQRDYLVDDSRVNFREERGPSTAMAVKLCSGIAITNTLKILLKRGPVISAPSGLHFDAYRNKFAKTWRPFGNKGLLPRIMLFIARRIVLKK
ncbi:ThiF family adenylyltransferase [Rheinheimera sp. UJ51]|uniref:ThiF family adenylyltransferase n=1 Tax=Rheinheimera sp. UJ51 TaxID=2892446 RepID=UPI001E40A01F|nr:ThiF family adenylyltransferase [Rheinheimera sp. UJ51]MCC5451112.1 ThiF family adenylyltransferase [Rheinheimera sp. UJ51]